MEITQSRQLVRVKSFPVYSTRQASWHSSGGIRQVALIAAVIATISEDVLQH